MNAIDQEILEYIKSHPQANDTAEGVATWWLLNKPEHLVQQALDQLVVMRRIKVQLTADGRKHYFGLSKEEEIVWLRTSINSHQSLIRMLEGSTDTEWLKKWEKEKNDPLRERIAELEKS